MVCSVSVHPRWRGEHNNAELHFLGTNGSSPLARGTPEDARSDAEFGRFIPAGAGNTSSPPWAMRSKTVHPRWRGEHVEDAMADLAIVGSSPLARGTLWCSSSRRAIRAVHPRWRGEHDDLAPEVLQ